MPPPVNGVSVGIERNKLNVNLGGENLRHGVEYTFISQPDAGSVADTWQAFPLPPGTAATISTPIPKFTGNCSMNCAFLIQITAPGTADLTFILPTFKSP